MDIAIRRLEPGPRVPALGLSDDLGGLILSADPIFSPASQGVFKRGMLGRAAF